MKLFIKEEHAELSSGILSLILASIFKNVHTLYLGIQNCLVYKKNPQYLEMGGGGLKSMWNVVSSLETSLSYRVKYLY